MKTYKSEERETNILREPQLAVRFDTAEKVEDLNDESKSTLNVLSLFSGCGGMDLGFEGGFTVLKSSVNPVLSPDFIDNEIDKHFVQLRKTRFKTVFANDILKEARNAWVNYFSKRGHSFDDFQTDSIVDLVKLHQQGVKVFPSDVDVVTGGFPCQDFSVAGKRKGFDSQKDHRGKLSNRVIATQENRGKLYMWMKQVIEIVQPKIFIAENVKGLVNLANVKDIIQSDFSSIGDNGYLVLDPRVLHSADYGVPQSRERVFFIGIRKSELSKNALEALQKSEIQEEYDPYPQPTHAYTRSGDKLAVHVALKDLFATLKEPEFSSDLSQMNYSKAKYMGKHCQGQTEVKMDGISPTIRAEHHGNIEFRRLSVENGGVNTDELSKGYEERRLTPRECALIQTFPPDYEFVIPKLNGRRGSYLVSPSKAYKIIGNAVPPLLAYNLARRIQDVWDTYFES
jgi:DNA (cytosine-5)-methyltransferase 1